MASPTSLLVVQFSDSFGELWSDLAESLHADVQLSTAASAEAVPSGVAVVILAAGGAERDAVEWLESHELRSTAPVFVAGADPGRRITAKLVGHGARDYFALPEDLEVLRNAVASAVRRHGQSRQRDDATVPDVPLEAFSEIVGESSALRSALGRAARALPHATATALILGETGTGKELLARAIHQGGPRAGAPFVPVNCSALPHNLIESELFGHERGAFTDAHAAKPGLFEIADGGTLFFDEIGTLPHDVQAKLLRVLEDKVVRRVGSTKSRTVDVRIVAATNEDLRDAVASGSFREDLYFRLSVIMLSLPPLRERGDDVLLITKHLLEHLAHQHGIPVPSLDPEIERALFAYAWPGNVRELRNAVERAMLLSPPGELSLAELIPAAHHLPTNGVLPFPASLDDITTAAARSTLKLCDGNRSEAARRLHISRRRLRRLLNEESATA